MNNTEFSRVCSILEDSEHWEPEILTRMPRLFMMAREIFLSSKNTENRDIF